MSMTPEQAAENVVGKYSVFIVATPRQMIEWGLKDAEHFKAYLRVRGITPCRTCGAYRKVDKCEICESELR